MMMTKRDDLELNNIRQLLINYRDMQAEVMMHIKKSIRMIAPYHLTASKNWNQESNG